MYEFMFLQLKIYGEVRSYPPSASNFQYESTAVKLNFTQQAFHQSKHVNTFLSFMIGLPLLGTFILMIVICSFRKKIENNLEKDTTTHQNFVAMLSMGGTFAWFALGIDITAMIHYQHADSIPTVIDSCSETIRNDGLFSALLVSIVLEGIMIVVLDLGPLAIRPCIELAKPNEDRQGFLASCLRIILCTRFELGEKIGFWTVTLPLIPPMWCLLSRLGFIIVAWTSFVRHSAAFTIFYIFAATTMFFIMRQAYIFVIQIWLKLGLGSGQTRLTPGSGQSTNEEDQVKNWMKDNGISLPMLWVVRLVGLFLVLFFTYLMFGLWLLPVAEVVEDAPVYLSDTLQLILVVLAVGISYRLYSLKKEENN